MGWDNAGYSKVQHAEDDVKITDTQTSEMRRLCEKKDARPAGSYSDMSWEMSRIEASRRIAALRKQVGED